MKFSRETYYGMRALAYMAKRPDAVFEAAQLARRARLPRPFLAKILHSLAQHGVLRSFRGAQRGYTLARPPERITIREVVEALEGSDIFERCVFWSHGCSDRAPCPLHDTWRTVRPVVASLLERMTIADVASGRRLPALSSPSRSRARAV
jgi:Rrf2 family transcriptional regulator, iron-sulfur cluster assembly transcription factor